MKGMWTRLFQKFSSFFKFLTEDFHQMYLLLNELSISAKLSASIVFLKKVYFTSERGTLSCINKPFRFFVCTFVFEL